MSEERTGAQIMCEALVREGVDVIFGIPGGAIMPFYHALPEYADQLHHVLCRHEQGAGHAAEGYARASGRVGVCVATSGPGATNLVTPIADAWMDSTPLVAITGQVPSSVLGKDAFQETDIVGITVPITKHSYLVSDIDELPRVFKEAFHIASTGRPGPVLIDITKDAQQARTVPDWSAEINLPGYRPNYHGNRRQIREAARLLTNAEKPLIMAGSGIIWSGANQELRQLAETVKSRGLMLTYHKPEHFPTLMLDETKLRQVIMNFVDNAIYYTPSGGRITVSLVENPQSIDFTVTDNGIGVPRHERHHMFTKFYRARNAMSARPDGTGLGLFMAKKVVIAQGGAIIFKSVENRGSTFGFTFPKAKLLRESAPKPQAEPAIHK